MNTPVAEQLDHLPKDTPIVFIDRSIAKVCVRIYQECDTAKMVSLRHALMKHGFRKEDHQRHVGDEIITVEQWTTPHTLDGLMIVIEGIAMWHGLRYVTPHEDDPALATMPRSAVKTENGFQLLTQASYLR